jgi:hypothetical protein
MDEIKDIEDVINKIRVKDKIIPLDEYKGFRGSDEFLDLFNCLIYTNNPRYWDELKNPEIRTPILGIVAQYGPKYS